MDWGVVPGEREGFHSRAEQERCDQDPERACCSGAVQPAHGCRISFRLHILWLCRHHRRSGEHMSCTLTSLFFQFLAALSSLNSPDICVKEKVHSDSSVNFSYPVVAALEELSSDMLRA